MTGMIYQTISIKDYVKNEKQKLKRKKSKKMEKIPVLNIVQVGNVEASNRYVRNKIKDAEELGIDAFNFKLVENITTEQLRGFVRELIGPTIVQLPLPEGVDAPSIARKMGCRWIWKRYLLPHVHREELSII